MDKELLLDSVKNKLNITWEDSLTNFKLSDLVNDAIVAMNFKLGADIDYSKNGLEHQLFLNYCLYSYNNCLNEFDTNYMNEIYQIRSIYEVKEYEENEIW
ncbi:Uncharacterised protein [uncultured Clostridium sp.]|nr:Uncharacterised protein [uncultured Clostridium sp.]